MLQITHLCGVGLFDQYHVLRWNVTLSFLLRINRPCGVGHFDPYHILPMKRNSEFYVPCAVLLSHFLRRFSYWRARFWDCLGTLGLRWYPHGVIQFSRFIAYYGEIVGAVILFPFTYIPYRKRWICPGISNFFWKFWNVPLIGRQQKEGKDNRIEKVPSIGSQWKRHKYNPFR